MERVVTQKQMIDYLQMFLTGWMEDAMTYGDEDRIVQKDLDRLCACKCMVETLIGQPVNLQMDGKVTVGY